MEGPSLGAKFISLPRPQGYDNHVQDVVAPTVAAVDGRVGGGGGERQAVDAIANIAPLGNNGNSRSPSVAPKAQESRASGASNSSGAASGQASKSKKQGAAVRGGIDWAATPEAWDRKRARITELYSNHTLTEVVRIMGEEGFHATERMYKYRIKEWGLAKHRKRRHADKETEPRKDRQRSIDDNASNSSKESRERAGSLTVAARATSETGLDSEELIKSVPFVLISNDQQTQFEKMLLSCKTHFNNYYDANVSSRSLPDGSHWRNLEVLFNCCYFANFENSIFRNRDVRNSVFGSGAPYGQILVGGKLKEIVQDRHPATLNWILACTKRGNDANTGLAQIVLSQCAYWARRYYGPNDPYRKLLSSGVSLISLPEEGTRSMRKLLADSFEEILGPNKRATIGLRAAFYFDSVFENDTQSALDALWQLSERCNKHFGPGDIQSLEVKLNLLQCLATTDQHSKFDSLRREIEQYIDLENPSRGLIRLYITALYKHALQERKDGNADSAQKCLEQTIGWSKMRSGWEPSETIAYMTILEDWQRQWGLAEEAQKTKEESVRLYRDWFMKEFRQPGTEFAMSYAQIYGIDPKKAEREFSDFVKGGRMLTFDEAEHELKGMGIHIPRGIDLSQAT